MKKNVFFAVLGGLVTCLACVGIVMLFSGNSSNYLKGNNGLPIEEDIFLGDSIASCATTTCPDGYSTHPTDQYTCMSSAPNGNEYENCSGTGLYWYMNACYNLVSKATYCASCPSYAYLSDHKCYTCGAGTHLAYAGCTGSSCCEPDPVETPESCLADGGKYYNTGSDSCASCPSGYQLESKTVGCSGTDESCCIINPALTCNTVQYNGNLQVIATCNDSCVIVYEDGSDGHTANETEVGTYTIRAEAFEGLTFADGTGSATCTATITEFTCPSGQYNLVQSTGTVTYTCVTCNNPGQYKAGSYCKTCPDGYSADASNQNCHITVPKGSYLVSPGQPGINSCPANTYSEGGVYNLTGGGSADVVGTASCKRCPSDRPYSPLGSGLDGCYAGNMEAETECSIKITSNAEIVSPTSVRAEYPGTNNIYPDTFTVTVTLTGNGCNGKKLHMTAINAARSSGSNSDFNATNGATYNILYQPTVDRCTTATITASVPNSSANSRSVSVNVMRAWTLVQTNYCTTEEEYNSYYHSYAEADANAGGKNPDYYAIALNNDCNNGAGGRKIDIYKRGCGGSAPSGTKYNYCCAKTDGTNYTWKSNQSSRSCPEGYTIDETKNASTCQNATVYKCYQDGDGAYHWTNSPGNSWVEVNKNENECKNEPACFEEPNGTRVWGIHFDKISQGYKLITSIKDETLCLNPSATDACYVNNDDDTDYKWSSTAPEGYTAVTGVTKAEDCQPALCYWKESTQTFEFGKYANTSGYFKVYDADDRPIADINKCAAPDGEACYKNPNGDYEWGDFSKDSDYTLVPSITTITKCTNEEVVPSTGIDVSKLVYVFMAVLMAVGIGFIYYSTIMKKEN